MSFVTKADHLLFNYDKLLYHDVFKWVCAENYYKIQASTDNFIV